MDKASLLIQAMADKCRRTILESSPQESASLPRPLRKKHLLLMCEKIERHAEDWPTTKLNRWIGFVQCAMIANRILDLDGAKVMFDRAKVAYAEVGEDLLDHLDPSDEFELDIGGEG